MSEEQIISFEGLDDILKALKETDKAVFDAAMRGLQAGAMDIINDAKENLRSNGSNVSNKLRSSGRVSRNGDEITAGFFDSTNREGGYAMYYEFGRRSGRMPPPSDLAAWAYKKFSLKDWKVANSMGWGLAKKIAENGTQPHPFFIPAVNKRTKGGEMSGVPASVAKNIIQIIRHGVARYAWKGHTIRNTPVGQE